jgi:hypothetical protein
MTRERESRRVWPRPLAPSDAGQSVLRPFVPVAGGMRLHGVYARGAVALGCVRWSTAPSWWATSRARLMWKRLQGRSW